MNTINENVLIEALETMLDQSWNGPIDCDHFAREKAAAALEFVRQKADPLADVRAKAEAGDAQAQYSLGYAYRFGDDVAKDAVEAVKWYRKAAEQGHAQAQFNLGTSYYFGNGVAKDLVEAVKWFRKAAEQGHAMAQTILGSAYSYGVWVKKDLTESEKWYRKAAEQEAGVTINK